MKQGLWTQELGRKSDSDLMVMFVIVARRFVKPTIVEHTVAVEAVAVAHWAHQSAYCKR
jgi:hypothetical protein